MHEPLFLKYRPQSLGDILGQDSVKETLINAINNDKIVHAYLLTGPRGSGKTSTARIIAKSLNCTNAEDGKSPSTMPCGKCESCESIANSSSIDVTEIDAASHGQVADARNLIERVNLASVSGKYRVYIIDEVHMLSNAAFNALLKVVEEPPKNVVFILATTEFDKVPKTIASRCQQLRFKPITINDVSTRIRYVIEQEKLNINEEAIESIAKHSDGAMRDALALLDQIGVFSNDQEAVGKEKVIDIIGAVASEDLEALVLAVLERDTANLIQQIDKMIHSGKEPVIITQELNDFILELMTNMSIGSDSMSELIAKLKEKEIENLELVQISDSLSELEIKLKLTTQTKALFKAWLIKLAHREDILVMKDLMQKLKELETGATKVNQTSSSTPTRPVSVNRAQPSPPQISDNPVPVSIPKVSVQQTQKEKPVANTAFLEYLSPGSKGMFISSKASLTKVEAPTATISIPNKFKFLKSKLEARLEEFISAISKEQNLEIKNINFELSDESVIASDEPAIASEVKQSQITPSQNSVNNQTCAVRSEESEEIIAVSLNKDKLDEVAEAAISIFGGKELKEEPSA